MINYHLSQKLKLLENARFNYLTIILIHFMLHDGLDKMLLLEV